MLDYGILIKSFLPVDFSNKTKRRNHRMTFSLANTLGECDAARIEFVLFSMFTWLIDFLER